MTIDSLLTILFFLARLFSEQVIVVKQCNKLCSPILKVTSLTISYEKGFLVKENQISIRLSFSSFRRRRLRMSLAELSVRVFLLGRGCPPRPLPLLPHQHQDRGSRHRPEDTNRALQTGKQRFSFFQIQ
jgi:hypothetical protein